MTLLQAADCITNSESEQIRGIKKLQLRAGRTDRLCWGWSFICGTMFLLGCSLLAGCFDQSTKNSATYCQWKFFNNTRIIGGDRQRVVASMSECQSICEASDTCKGFDWSAFGGPDNLCILHTTQDGKQTDYYIIHYDKGNCTECLWHETNNVKQGGSTENSAPDLYTCQNACVFTENCQSIDWWYDGPMGGQCRLLSSRDNTFSAPAWTHFDVSCNIDCRWNLMDDTQIIGGTLNPANDIIACQHACLPRSGCKGIDWRSDQDEGQKCYLLFQQYGQSRAPGVTHFDLFCGTDCQWRRMDGWQIGGYDGWQAWQSRGGTANPAPDIVSCQIACLATDGCKGVDWALYKDPRDGQKCTLLFKNDGKYRQRATGVNHFDLFCSGGKQASLYN